MLCVIMLNVVKLNVPNNPFMLSVVMLSVVMLNVIMLSVVAPFTTPTTMVYSYNEQHLIIRKNKIAFDTLLFEDMQLLVISNYYSTNSNFFVQVRKK
jgi:hypothetical protein